MLLIKLNFHCIEPKIFHQGLKKQQKKNSYLHSVYNNIPPHIISFLKKKKSDWGQFKNIASKHKQYDY